MTDLNFPSAVPNRTAIADTDKILGADANGVPYAFGIELFRYSGGESVAVATWPALAAIDTAGLEDGRSAKVYGPDAGDHVDPVTEETVDNEGIYSATPDGWRRVANLDVADVNAARQAALAEISEQVDIATAAANDPAVQAVGADLAGAGTIPAVAERADDIEALASALADPESPLNTAAEKAELVTEKTAVAVAAALEASNISTRVGVVASTPVLRVLAASGTVANGGGAYQTFAVTPSGLDTPSGTLSFSDLTQIASRIGLISALSTPLIPSVSQAVAATGGTVTNGGGSYLIFASGAEQLLSKPFQDLQSQVAEAGGGGGGTAIYGAEPLPEARIDFKRVPTHRYALPEHGQSLTIGPDPVLLDVAGDAHVRMLGSTCRTHADTATADWTASNVAAWGSFDRAAEEKLIGSLGDTGHLMRGKMFLDTVSQLLGVNVRNYGQTVLVASSGAGGRTADQLITAGGYIGFLGDVIEHGTARAADAGLDLRIPSLTFSQGHADADIETSKASWKAKVAELPAIVAALQLAETGADIAVPIMINQSAICARYGDPDKEAAAWDIMQAQRELAEFHPDFVFGSVEFAGDYLGDNSHPVALHTARLKGIEGARQGIMAALGIRPSHPLVIDDEWTAHGVILTYDRDMELDVQTISNPVGFNYGGAFRSSGGANVPITACGRYLGHARRFFWETASAPASGWGFFLGRCGLPGGVFGGAGIGKDTGARHCLRDRMGDRLPTLRIGDAVIPMHNFAPAYETFKA